MEKITNLFSNINNNLHTEILNNTKSLYLRRLKEIRLHYGT